MTRFAETRAYLRRRGMIISDFDIIIGSTALLHDLTVITRNLRHFRCIPDLRIYTPDA
jgi:tRNA(fMet)-specific endonuclease VapC